MRLAGRAVLLVALCLALAEGMLQLGALFVHNREAAADPNAAIRVLCIGDSHTYGAPLTEPESYPAQLQAMLDARAPGRYSVVNAGIPGTNTAQWRERLPMLLDKYAPQMVVMWVGVNNLWNGAEFDKDAETWRERLGAFASHFRLYKLARVWTHDQAIDAARIRAGGRLESSVERPNAGAVWTVKHDDGTTEVLQNDAPQFRAGEVATRHAHDDFAAMVEMLRARGIAVAMISYPRHNEFFEPANRAIRAVAAELQVPLVDGTASAERVPEPQRIYLQADHPSAPIYREVAVDVARLVP